MAQQWLPWHNKWLPWHNSAERVLALSARAKRVLLLRHKRSSAMGAFPLSAHTSIGWFNLVIMVINNYKDEIFGLLNRLPQNMN